MTTLEIVLAFLLSTGSPFGPQTFTLAPIDENSVVVEFPTHGVALIMNRDLTYEVIEGRVEQCLPEKDETDV